MIEKYTFKALNTTKNKSANKKEKKETNKKSKNPHILFFGSVHGNEVCGSLAIDRLVKDIRDGKIKLKSGKVTFVPRVNAKAYEMGVRFVDKNLNRIFKHNINPKLHEESLANELLETFVGVTHFVDLHSMTARTAPISFMDYVSAKNRELIYAAQIPHVLTSWPSVYKSKDEISDDTTRYANSLGIAAITIECGQHKDKASVRVAYESMINVLAYYGVIEDEFLEKVKRENFKIIKMKEVIYKKSMGDQFVKDFKNMNILRKGEVILMREDREKVSAKEDIVILLPNKAVSVGGEMCYLGKVAIE